MESNAPVCACGCGKPVTKNSRKTSAWNRFYSANCYNRMQKTGQPTLTQKFGDDTWEVTGDSAEVTKTTSERVKTLDDLIRVCEIDLDTWEIERWVCNKWEMAMGTGPKEGRKAVVTPLYQIKVWLRVKVAVVDAKNEIADLVKTAKERITFPPRVAGRKKEVSSGLLLEIAIPDLHAGKLAWGKETGHANYDTAIAERVFESALATLLERTSHHPIERVLLVLGNDLLNADNTEGTTWKGTQQDSDLRFQKTFTVVRNMTIRAIERLRSIAPVDALMVPGNHDKLSVWHLGDSLDCYFHAYEDVRIDNAPRLRKYYQHGKVMLMFTHGDRGKHADYPLLMATEQPKMFGECTIAREAHTGHRHKTEANEYHGVKVRVSPALCPPDAWHAEMGFVGQGRAAEAFVWSKDEGLIGTAHYTVKE